MVQSQKYRRALAMVLFLSGTVKAQTVSWTQVGYSTAPSARENSFTAYDAATRSTVLFGGYNGDSVLGDTWTWDGTWRSMLPATSPSPRQGSAIAYNGAAENVVLFGCSTVPFVAGMAYGDTWTWDGTNWTQQFPPVSPSPRQWATVVYDPLIKGSCFSAAAIRRAATMRSAIPGRGMG